MIKEATLSQPNAIIPNKIVISQTEFDSTIEIKRINDVDLILFTHDFFKKMGISIIDIKLKYTYLSSQKEIVLKGEDSLKSEIKNVTKNNSFIFIKKRANLTDTIWNGINSLFKKGEDIDSTINTENKQNIVLSNKTNEHPNLNYSYTIVFNYDNKPGENIMSLNTYLQEIKGGEISIERFSPSNLNYYEIGRIIYDIHQQMLYLKSMSTIIVEIAIEDIFIVQNRFIIINTQRMINVSEENIPRENYERILDKKTYCKAMLNFIKKITNGVNPVKIEKNIEYSYLHKYISRLLDGEFQI